jgi:redox-sensitive bicupin YhaK (pirin superfamily)
MGFRALRVLNQDRIAPGAGFGMHPHQDMEILTFMLSGTIEHRDSLGSGTRIRPGDVQRMTAGSGVVHSEFNPSAQEEARLLQVWILPETNGLTPAYEQRSFADVWQLVASRDGRDGSLLVHQNVSIYRGRLGAGESRRHEITLGRHAWVQIASGEVRIAGESLAEGDGIAASDEREITILSTTSSEVLLFDLA